DELHAERLVTGDRPRFQQGLELPRARPALVVRTVRAERTDERAVLPFRPQCGVDAERLAVFRGRRESLDQSLADLGGPWDRLLVLAVGHEDHVDVAGVVQLFAAELPHPDHREARALG